MEMLLTGEPIDAARALEWGLVNRVVPAEQLDDEIGRLTASVLSRSSAVVGLGKSAFYDQVELELEDAYRSAAEAMTANMALQDAAEGIDAFVGKRRPVWRDR
jgi:enoyl-CoA hydratase/carnithine racemase